MDMLPVQARFATQDQAEAAIRKLASLRGDQFRLERVPSAAPAQDEGPDVGGFSASLPAGSTIQSSGGVMASADVAAQQWGVTPEGGITGAEFALSANVPGSAENQARSVIEQAGGQML